MPPATCHAGRAAVLGSRSPLPVPRPSSNPAPLFESRSPLPIPIPSSNPAPCRGLPYTVVHPGGLINEPGGRREIVIGVDDERSEGERSIPREDVAEVLVQALLIPAYRGRSFDIRSKLEGEGEVTTDFAALVEQLGDRNCDYTLGEIA